MNITAEHFLTARSGFPAIVAGGAIRDTLLGKDVKDVDVFIPVQALSGPPLNATASRIDLVFDKYGSLVQAGRPHNVFYLSGHRGISLHKTSEEYEVETGFVSYQCEQVPGLNVIIRTDVPAIHATNEAMFVEHVLSTFPVSISKVAKGMLTDEMFITKEFWDTATSKKIMYKANCDEAYLNRIMNKYPTGDWLYLMSPVHDWTTTPWITSIPPVLF